MIRYQTSSDLADVVDRCDMDVLGAEELVDLAPVDAQRSIDWVVELARRDEVYQDVFSHSSHRLCVL